MSTNQKRAMSEPSPHSAKSTREKLDRRWPHWRCHMRRGVGGGNGEGKRGWDGEME